MASNAYHSPATSPPYPSSAVLPNPKKRHSGGFPPIPNKRRKQSSFSTSTTSTHPLRQTSFPPEESAAQGERSPSVESDVTGITTGTGGKSIMSRSRGRPKSILKKRANTATESVKSGPKAGTADGRSKISGGAAEDAAEEEDEDEQQEDGLVDTGGKVDKVAEEKKMAVLIDAFDSEQADRYNAYRRQKLKKETVRRITNQTLSQSVPPSVILTITAFSKIFIGNIIERARDVQAELAHAAERSLISPPPSNAVSPKTREDGETAAAGGQAGEGLLLTPDTLTQESLSEGKPKPKKKKAQDLGPLLPDHLREALRRYKRDGVGGGAGVGGTSLGLGMLGSGSARLQGRRLFK